MVLPMGRITPSAQNDRVEWLRELRLAIIQTDWNLNKYNNNKKKCKCQIQLRMFIFMAEEEKIRKRRKKTILIEIARVCKLPRIWKIAKTIYVGKSKDLNDFELRTHLGGGRFSRSAILCLHGILHCLNHFLFFFFFSVCYCSLIFRVQFQHAHTRTHTALLNVVPTHHCANELNWFIL